MSLYTVRIVLATCVYTHIFLCACVTVCMYVWVVLCVSFFCCFFLISKIACHNCYYSCVYILNCDYSCVTFQKVSNVKFSKVQMYGLPLDLVGRGVVVVQSVGSSQRQV